MNIYKDLNERLECHFLRNRFVSSSNNRLYNLHSSFNSFFTDRLFFKKTEDKVFKRAFAVPVSDSEAITIYVYERVNNRLMNFPSPLIFFIKDTNWEEGNLDFYFKYCDYLCSLTNAIVVMPDFRPSSVLKFPSATLDCYKSLEWAVTGSKYWKIHPKKIFLFGANTGATIACGVSLKVKEKANFKIAGQILISPFVDARMKTESFLKYENDPFLSKKDLQNAIDNYINDSQDIFSPLLSPLLAINHFSLPDALIFAGQRDILKDDALLYAKILEKSGVKTWYFELNDTINGFIYLSRLKTNERVDFLIKSFIEGRNLSTMGISVK